MIFLWRTRTNIAEWELCHPVTWMQVSDIKNKLFHPVQSNDCTQLQTRPCVIQNLSMSMKCFFKQLQVSSVEKG